MEFDINLWSVFWAAIASMVVGSIWYAKGVFGTPWMSLSGMSDKKMQQIREKQGWMPMIAMFLLALVMAYVLAHVVQIFVAYDSSNSYLSAAIMSGFWMWVGFVVPTTLGTGLFSGTRKKLMAINLGNWLVTLLVMGWVFGLLGSA